MKIYLNTKPLSEITNETIRLLYHELGTVNTVRFINQFTTGYGNYTEERRGFVDEYTLDELVAEIKARREHKTTI